jgi:hypothetical protein
MLARELAIVLRARVTWLQAALSALLVGHGFILAVDLYTASSRSAQASLLQQREMDPLLGVVRPTLGGLYLAVSLLGALVAARVVSIEKERHTFRPLLLQTAAPIQVTLSKFVAGCLGVFTQWLAPIGLLIVWRIAGGHLGFGETITGLIGYALYMIVVAAIATAAATWTETFAQAATVAILVVAASWAIDASEGFAALAWLGRALNWSVTTHLEPMERGTLAIGACLWLLVVAAGALGLAVIGARYDLSRRTRSLWAISVVVAMGVGCTLAHGARRAYDLTETHRLSLPPAAASALRGLPRPIRLDVYLDRDDSRRRQLESDVLAKLQLARSDIDIEMPLDGRVATEAARDEDYGRIVIRVGSAERTTISAGRKEIVTQIFEAAGRALPDWSQPEYEGYPLVVQGGKRTALAALAYGGLPLSLVIVGWFVTRSRRRT